MERKVHCHKPHIWFSAYELLFQKVLFVLFVYNVIKSRSAVICRGFSEIEIFFFLTACIWKNIYGTTAIHREMSKLLIEAFLGPTLCV